MAKKELTVEQKRLDMDLWIVIIISLAVMGLYIVLQNQVRTMMQDSAQNILLRVLLGAGFQFGLAGLGITVVSVIRKESFRSHGLRGKGSISSIVLCVCCFMPHIIFLLVTNQVSGYLPFQTVWTTKEVLDSGFPSNMMGMLITTTVWGFFEGFNYVVISDKINKRYPSKNKWLNRGAIFCAVLCILIHGAIGVTPEGIVEMFTILIIIYGMLMAKEWTGNAWGCIFIFVFLWNAM